MCRVVSSLSNFLHPIPHPGHRECTRDCRVLCYTVGVRAGAGALLHKSSGCLSLESVTQQGLSSCKRSSETHLLQSISGAKPFGKYQSRHPEAVNSLRSEE